VQNALHVFSKVQAGVHRSNNSLDEIVEKMPRILRKAATEREQLNGLRSALVRQKPVRGSHSTSPPPVVGVFLLLMHPAVFLDNLQNTLPGSSPGTEHGYERAVSAA
jgi:hypothetical protein